MFYFSFELEFRLSRNDVAIAFVNAILCPDGSDPVEISLSELQKRVENQINLLKPKQNISFETRTGMRNWKTNRRLQCDFYLKRLLKRNP